jgi:hypothetical protein
LPPFDSSEGATEALCEVEADWTDDWLSSQSIVAGLFVLALAFPLVPSFLFWNPLGAGTLPEEGALLPDKMRFLARSDAACCGPIGCINENAFGCGDGEDGAVGRIPLLS